MVKNTINLIAYNEDKFLALTVYFYNFSSSFSYLKYLQCDSQ